MHSTPTQISQVDMYWASAIFMYLYIIAGVHYYNNPIGFIMPKGGGVGRENK